MGNNKSRKERFMETLRSLSDNDLAQWIKSKRDRAKILRAIDRGRVTMRGVPPTLDGEPDWTITSLSAQCGLGYHGSSYIKFLWQTKSAGFGELLGYVENGKWIFHSEYLPKEFIRKVLNYWVEQSILEHELSKGEDPCPNDQEVQS